MSKLSIKSTLVKLLEKYNSKDELVFTVLNGEPLKLDQIYQDPNTPEMIVFSLLPSVSEDMKERIRRKAQQLEKEKI